MASAKQHTIQKKSAHLKADNSFTPGPKGVSMLPPSVLGSMGNAFQTDFSDVRVHTNSSSALDLNALAYTKGNDIHFAPGQFNPNSLEGKKLIGHELTHVMQQRTGNVSSGFQAKGFNINNDKSLEKEADVLGEKAAKGQSVKLLSNSIPANGIQKKCKKCEEEEHRKPVQKKSAVVQMKCSGKAKHGPGAGMTEMDTGSSFIWRIYNFDINKSFLKKEHQDYLLKTVIPKINAISSSVVVMVSGHASTTGTDGLNFALSTKRADCTKNFLLSNGVTSPTIRSGGMGETSPFTRGTPDNTEVQEDRAVRIQVVPTSKPGKKEKPKPKPKPKPNTEEIDKFFDQLTMDCTSVVIIEKFGPDMVCQAVPPQVCGALIVTPDAALPKEMLTIKKSCCSVEAPPTDKEIADKIDKCVLKDAEYYFKRDKIDVTPERIKEEYKKYKKRRSAKK